MKSNTADMQELVRTEIVTPSDYVNRYQLTSAKWPERLPLIAAAKIKVANLQATHAYLSSRKVPFVETASGSLVVAAKRASGLLIEFVP